MLNNKKDEGFTLIEILIAINLAFIVIGLLVSFYLFTARFVTSFSKSQDDKEILSDSAFRMQEMIRKKSSFIIKRGFDKEVCFIFNTKDTIKFAGDSLKISNLYSVRKIDEYNIKLILLSGEEVQLNNAAQGISTLFQDEEYSSDRVNLVFITLKKNNYEINFEVVRPKTPENSFKNIESERIYKE